MPNCNATSGYRIYIINADGDNRPNQLTQDIHSGAIYKLVNRNSGKLLGVHYNSKQDGANVIQWGLNNDYNQQWRLVRVN